MYMQTCGTHTDTSETTNIWFYFSEQTYSLL